VDKNKRITTSKPNGTLSPRQLEIIRVALKRRGIKVD
tara:strand:- start:193 stop:303 length:111 start_codon:yes stop_codon:yes gene_type:complete